MTIYDSLYHVYVRFYEVAGISMPLAPSIYSSAARASSPVSTVAKDEASFCAISR